MNALKSAAKLFVYILMVHVAIGLAGCDDSGGGGGAPNSLGMTPARLPLAMTGQPYSTAVRAYFPGTDPGCPYAWTTSGQLPPGLTYSNPDNGLLAITGTPTAAGTYTVTIHVSSCAGWVEELRTIVVADSLELSGNWSFTIAVTAAGGECISEVGQQSTRAITITQSATGAPDVFNIKMDGFVGVPGNILTGQLTGWSRVEVSGQYPEEGGITTSSHSLTVYTPDEMGGLEQWSWTDPVVTCPGGLATVTATRQP